MYDFLKFILSDYVILIKLMFLIALLTVAVLAIILCMGEALNRARKTSSFSFDSFLQKRLAERRNLNAKKKKLEANRKATTPPVFD